MAKWFIVPCLHCVRSILNFISFFISIVILTRWCRYQTGSLAPIVRWLAVRAQHIMSAPQEPPQIRPNAQPAPGRANLTVLAQEFSVTRCIICLVAHVWSLKRVCKYDVWYSTVSLWCTLKRTESFGKYFAAVLAGEPQGDEMADPAPADPAGRKCW